MIAITGMQKAKFNAQSVHVAGVAIPSCTSTNSQSERVDIVQCVAIREFCGSTCSFGYLPRKSRGLNETQWNVACGIVRKASSFASRRRRRGLTESIMSILAAHTSPSMIRTLPFQPRHPTILSPSPFYALPFGLCFGTSVIVSPAAERNTPTSVHGRMRLPGAAAKETARIDVARTRRQRLLQLIGLVRVLEDQRVQVAVAPHLELDLVALARLLDARGFVHLRSPLAL